MYMLLRVDSWEKINPTEVPFDPWNVPQLVSVDGSTLCVMGQKFDFKHWRKYF